MSSLLARKAFVFVKEPNQYALIPIQIFEYSNIKVHFIITNYWCGEVAFNSNTTLVLSGDVKADFAI